ncbi:MAG TPA: TCP-1/cpn60 chaperonin family protein, partial [Ignavibacteriaceae bacterium]
KEGKDDFGFNAASETYENLIKSGVIDPTKVTRTALENAASVASLLITTEAVVFEKKEKETPMPPMPGGGMGDMGGMY